ncbi:MAG: glucosyl-3-phosphoglycerate synthase [Acidimicrobiaceae bacterium]|nr:glucosyl-3-phosphoglycerate synthase [Acidimicrobiaceae bacterium]
MRTFSAGSFDVDALVEAKRGRRISVCLPARDEETTIGAIVTTIRRHLVSDRPLVDEVLVLDDGSADATADIARAAGAGVRAVGDVLPELGPGRGKGEAMWKAVYEASGDILVFCDADVRDFDPRFVIGLVGPLLLSDDIGFVKGFYDRPIEGRPGQGGRVTELVARPLLSLLFPALTGMVQPLAGECAGRREVLEQLPFVEAYGVDLGLVLDVVSHFGLAALAQCDLGTRVHRNRTLEELAPQAAAVLQTALGRAGVATHGDIAERPPWVTVPAYRKSA